MKEVSPVRMGYLLLGANLLLFALKLWAFFLSNSMAILSDATNSLTDSIASIAVAYSLKISSKSADKSHPFGHYRVEPLAALFVAIVAIFLSIDIIKSAIFRFFQQEDIILHPFSIGVIVFTIALKAFLFFWLGHAAKKHRSPSLEAGSVDARNDVIVSIIVLFGFLSTLYHWHIVDSIAAILLGLWILRTAYTLGRKNIDYLVGKRGDESVHKELKKILSTIPNVILKKFTSHYVGNKLHIEVIVVVQDTMTVKEAHQLSHQIENTLCQHEEVADVFVHIEPKNM